MYKILMIATLLLSGCSNFKVTATMCDSINREPGTTIPEECRAYNKKKADEAFDNKRNKQIESAEDIIEFNKETNDK